MSVFERGETGSFEFVDEGAILTPVETDRFLRRLNNELGMAQLAVRRARSRELDCVRKFMTARAPLLLDPDCPKVGRRAGETTQRQQDEWLAERIPAEYWAWKQAEVERRNAVDYADQVKNQVEIMRSLNVNAKAIYDTYRGGR